MIAQALSWASKRKSRKILSNITTLTSEIWQLKSGTNFEPPALIGDS